MYAAGYPYGSIGDLELLASDSPHLRNLEMHNVNLNPENFRDLSSLLHRSEVDALSHNGCQTGHSLSCPSPSPVRRCLPWLRRLELTSLRWTKRTIKALSKMFVLLSLKVGTITDSDNPNVLGTRAGT